MTNGNGNGCDNLLATLPLFEIAIVLLGLDEVVAYPSYPLSRNPFVPSLRIMTAKAHLWKTFRVPSSDRPHVSKAEIEADRENLKDSVFRIKHGAERLTDAGDSMTSLEHVRALIESPPEHLPDWPVAFCDFAGPGRERVNHR